MEVKEEEKRAERVKRKLVFDDEDEIIPDKSVSPEQELNCAASRLYCALAIDPGKNLVFSPLSIFAVLGMVFEGAREETADEILNFIGPDAPKFLPLYLKERRVTCGNSILLNSDFRFEGAFVNSVLGKYDAMLQRIDLAGTIEQKDSAKRINDWVSMKTDGRIRKLVDASNLDSLTALVLVNALHFSGRWEHAFPPSSTIECPFHEFNGRVSVVALMSNTASVHYAAFSAAHEPFSTPAYNRTGVDNYPPDGFQVLELPFNDSTLSMIFVLPMRVNETDRRAAEQFFRKSDMFESFREVAELRKVDVSIPRFSIDHTECKLLEHLQSLGVQKMFETGSARLDGITGDPGEVAVTNIFHKTAIDVKEEGVEAASATALSAGVRSLPKFVPEFIASRAFMFAVCDRKSGLVLIMGHFTNN